MLEAVKLMAARGWPQPICIAVHGLFADDSDTLLQQAGARIVTSNSVPHRSNALDTGSILATAVKQLAGSDP
jgi:ribose-phosphate pyrophosphokinase